MEEPMIAVGDLGQDLALLGRYGYVVPYPGGIVIYVPDIEMEELFDLKSASNGSGGA